MLTLDQIVQRLKDRRPGILADKTGLSERTITRIRDRETKDPAVSVIKALSDYFEEQEREPAQQ